MVTPKTLLSNLHCKEQEYALWREIPEEGSAKGSSSSEVYQEVSNIHDFPKLWKAICGQKGNDSHDTDYME